MFWGSWNDSTCSSLPLSSWSLLPSQIILSAPQCIAMAKKSRYCKEGLLRAVAGLMSFLFNLFIILSVVSVCLLGLIWPELHEEYCIEEFAFGIAIACPSSAPSSWHSLPTDLRWRNSLCEQHIPSALQLWLLAWIFQSTGEYKGWIWLCSAFSSILLIGKSGAESSLTFSEQLSFDEVPFKKKLALLLWFALVYILSALFRIITLALITDRDLLYPWLALALGLPLTVLLTLKLAGWQSLEDLAPGHILLGVLGELTSITLWGEDERRQQEAQPCNGIIQPSPQHHLPLNHLQRPVGMCGPMVSKAGRSSM